MEDRIIFTPTVPEDEKRGNYESHVTDKTMDIPKNITDSKPIERQDIELYPKEHAFLLYNVLSPSECHYFIETAEKFGLEPVYNNTNYRKDYRNNDRVVVRSSELAELVFNRIKSFLTDIEITRENKQNVGPGYNIDGLWQPIGLNETWRICKYYPGGHFAPHYDGNYIRQPEERSMKTFMVYLNDDFVGGSTNFVDEKQALYKNPSTGIYCAEESNILLKIAPKTGMALVFNHHILHEGHQLETKTKYIMRSDIMFKKIRGRMWKSEKEKEAVFLLQQAEQLETDGKYMEAAECYRLAYLKWPDLELEMLAK